MIISTDLVNHSPFSSVVRQLAIAGLLITSTLQLLEFTFLSSLTVAFALIIYTWFGGVITERCGLVSVGFGPAFVIGVTFYIIMCQIFLLLNFQSLTAHWAAFFLLAVIGLLFQFVVTPRSGQLPRSASREFLLSFSLGLMVFALRQPWLLPFAVSLVFAERISTTTSGVSIRKRFATELILPISGWLTSLLIRIEGWSYFYLGGDTGFFESIGWITAEFSIFEHPGLSGGSIAGYHWLSYTFLGSLSHLAGLAPWEATTRMGPPLLLITLAGLIAQSPLRVAARPLTHMNWLVVFMIVVGASFQRYDSASFGLLTGLVFLSLLSRSYRLNVRVLRQFFIFAIAAFAVIMSKATTGLVIGVTLILLWLELRRRGLRPTLTSIYAFSAVGVLTLVLFFRSSQFTDAGRTLRVTSLDATITETILGTPYLIWGALIIFMALAWPDNAYSGDLIGTSLLRCLVTVAVFVVALGFVAQYQQQVMHASFFIAAACASWVLLERLSSTGSDTQVRTSDLSRPLWMITVTLAALVGFTAPVFYNRIDRISEIPEWLGVRGWEIAKVILPFVIPWMVLIASTREWFSRREMLSRVALVTTAMILTGLTLDQARRATRWGPSVSVNWALNDSAMPSDNLRAVGGWIRSTTDSAAVIASNDFCCFGDEWWKVIVGNLEAHADGRLKWWLVLQDSQWWTDLEAEYGRGVFDGGLKDTRLGGDNYLLAGESRRRQLIQGLKHQASIPTADQVNRMNLSLAFANAPNVDVIRGLKSYGVTGYVANLSLTEHRDWSGFAIEKFRSGNYVYLELK